MALTHRHSLAFLTLSPPVNTVIPDVVGPLVVGEILETDDGTWVGADYYTYQWQRDTVGSWDNIAGATNRSYTLSVADVGADIRVAVTAYNDSGSTVAYSDRYVNIAQYGPIYTAPPRQVRNFRVIHYNHEDEALGEAFPNNLEFAIYLSRTGYCNYDLDTGAFLARRAYTAPYLTDFRLQYGETDIMGGLHTAVSFDELEGHVIKVAGKDWLHYLEKRQYPFDPNSSTFEPYLVSDRDLFLIVEDILDTVLAEPNSLAFTYDNGSCGQTANYKIEPGDTGNIMDKLTELAGGNPGFDFEATPDRQIILYYPKKGTTVGIPLVGGMNITELRYTNNGPQGTHTLGMAQGASSRMGYVVDSWNQPEYRRLDISEELSNVSEEADLQAKTQGASDRNAVPSTEFTAKVILENLNPFEELHVGDTALVQADIEYDTINDYYRIVGIQCSPTDEGDYEVELTLDDGTISL